MEIFVEDGTGLVTANAYASLAEVDNLLSVNIHSKWSLLDDQTAKENLIMWATRLLDQRVRWYGHKTHATSGLAWPRTGVRDKDRHCVEDDIVPKQVKLATAILAEHLLAGNPEAVNSGSNITALQVDVIALKFDTNKTPDKYPVELRYILDGLGFMSFGRGGPKRIILY